MGMRAPCPRHDLDADQPVFKQGSARLRGSGPVLKGLIRKTAPLAFRDSCGLRSFFHVIPGIPNINIMRSVPAGELQWEKQEQTQENFIRLRHFRSVSFFYHVFHLKLIFIFEFSSFFIPAQRHLLFFLCNFQTFRTEAFNHGGRLRVYACDSVPPGACGCAGCGGPIPG